MPLKKKPEDIACKILWVTKRTHRRFGIEKAHFNEIADVFLNRILDFWDEHHGEDTENETKRKVPRA